MINQYEKKNKSKFYVNTKRNNCDILLKNKEL